jgi:hypothetical protein
LQGVVAYDKMVLDACLFWFTWITGLVASSEWSMQLIPD